MFVCTEDNPGESKFGCEGEGAVVTNKSDLVCHEASRSHVTAMEHKAAKAGAPGGIRHGMAAAATTTTAVKTLFPTLLLVALWLITEHVAMVKFPSLLALLVMTGNEAIKHKYNTTRYFWSCLYALSEVLLLAQRSALLNSPFYNILIDNSTDISAEDHLLIYARYIDADTFEFKTQYLCAVRIVCGTADIMFNAVILVLEVLGLDKSKLVAFCADGASANMGRTSGVATKFRNLVSYLFAVHCIAHRSALVMGDVQKKSKELQEIDKVLTGVHALFRSTKRQAQWSAFAKLKGLTRFRFSLYNKTRWFSRMQCIITLCMNLHFLILFLQANPDWPAGQAFLTKNKRAKLVTSLFLLWDLLDPIEMLCTGFQKDDLYAHNIEVVVNYTIDKIKSIFGGAKINLEGSSHLKEFVMHCSKEFVWRPCEGVTIQLSAGKFKLKSLFAFSKSLSSLIISELNERFADDVSILSHFRVFDPSSSINNHGPRARRLWHNLIHNAA